MKCGVINSGEVARAAWLVLLRAKSKAIHVNTLIRASGVGLVRLYPREVRTFALRESILTVQLELSSDTRVLAPAMHIQRGLRKNECTSIRNTRVLQMRTISRKTTMSGNTLTTKIYLIVRIGRSMPVSSEAITAGVVKSTSIIEKSASINEGTAVSSNRGRATESMDGIRKSINSISVVEGLGAKYLEKKSIASQRRAIIYVLIGLDYPDELLHGVIEVQLNLVTGRTNRLITSELELSNQVLVRILGHTSALISIQEHIVNIQRGSNQRLIVSNGGRDRATNSVLLSRTAIRIGVAVQSSNSPQALINRTNIKVNLDFMVLESNQRQSKTRVGAKPELKRYIKSSLRKGITRSANLTRS